MEAAEKISITLTPEMARSIREDVEKGRYASTSEAIRDALRLWQQKKEEHEARLESIRQRVEASINDPRPDVPREEVSRRMDELYERAMATGKYDDI
ncbi:type II toxin-antitoxin system ParD family antitoxin [Pelagibacterium sediminicola]|uniref:type II toxin-antitoxin system ParD family antitoxin n=1 Tax=Pelagibacterium sediminicola TaxID=2248761 RepID=UPI000E320EDF|nr:type II toxin-antitoxin system ParD family antitoxin [Pelagibacterium sediminicola]